MSHQPLLIQSFSTRPITSGASWVILFFGESQMAWTQVCEAASLSTTGPRRPHRKMCTSFTKILWSIMWEGAVVTVSWFLFGTFPLNNLLTVYSTFWPEVEVKQKSCCWFKKIKKEAMIGLVMSCRMLPADQIWSDLKCLYCGQQVCLPLLTGILYTRHQTNLPPLRFAFFCLVPSSFSHLLLEQCEVHFFVMGGSANVQILLKVKGQCFVFVFIFSLFFNCHIWMLKVQCEGLMGIYQLWWTIIFIIICFCYLCMSPLSLQMEWDLFHTNTDKACSSFFDQFTLSYTFWEELKDIQLVAHM